MKFKNEILNIYIFIFTVLMLFWQPFSPQPSIAAAKDKTAGADASKDIEFLKFIPSEYQLVVHVNAEKFLKELSGDNIFNGYLADVFDKRNVQKIKTLDFSFPSSKNKDGVFDFICIVSGELDFNMLVDKIKEYPGVMVGEHEGFSALRYHNLAGIYCKGFVIFGTKTSLKKVIEISKKKSKSLFEDNEFTSRYIAAAGFAENKKNSVSGALNGNFLINLPFFCETSYKKFINETQIFYFTIENKKAEIIFCQKDKASAEGFSLEIKNQFAQSVKDTAEALADLDIIMAEDKSARSKKNAINEAAFNQKFLKLILDFNKNARVGSKETCVTISIGFKENFLQILYDLITTHVNSWGVILEYFISSEITCKKYIKLIEMAAVLYLSKHPEAKNSLNLEAIYEEDMIGCIYKCPKDGVYSIKVDDRGKIAVKCSAHDK